MTTRDTKDDAYPLPGNPMFLQNSLHILVTNSGKKTFRPPLLTDMLGMPHKPLVLLRFETASSIRPYWRASFSIFLPLAFRYNSTATMRFCLLSYAEITFYGSFAISATPVFSALEIVLNDHFRWITPSGACLPSRPSRPTDTIATASKLIWRLETNAQMFFYLLWIHHHQQWSSVYLVLRSYGPNGYPQSRWVVTTGVWRHLTFCLNGTKPKSSALRA